MVHYNGLNDQPLIVVKHAYNGVVLLTACPVCGAVVLDATNQKLHDAFHKGLEE
jgi:hypothetical protein